MTNSSSRRLALLRILSTCTPWAVSYTHLDVYKRQAYATPEQTFANAAIVMRAGANMVKLEGGAWLADTVRMGRR